MIKISEKKLVLVYAYDFYFKTRLYFICFPEVPLKRNLNDYVPSPVSMWFTRTYELIFFKNPFRHSNFVTDYTSEVRTFVPLT